MSNQYGTKHICRVKHLRELEKPCKLQSITCFVITQLLVQPSSNQWLAFGTPKLNEEERTKEWSGEGGGEGEQRWGGVYTLFGSVSVRGNVIVMPYFIVDWGASNSSCHCPVRR